MLKSDALAAYPLFPWLWADDAAGVAAFLSKRGWLAPGERVVDCGRAGEGNMNLTLRVRTSQRSLVLKQARPWVEKYEQFAAPWERTEFEERFYRRTVTIPGVAQRMPRLLAADREARTLLLEDLGNVHDLTSIYHTDHLTTNEVNSLAQYLHELHQGTAGTCDAQFANRAMRTLNHQHMYHLPLDPQNGLDLDKFEPGLQAAARALQNDPRVVELVHATGQRYTNDGRYLLHGDYFPGSWLRTERGVMVIDPEFCFCGDREFDLGVAMAHFALAGQPNCIEQFVGAYPEPGGERLDHAWLSRYAACEVIRRLIGVAQLALPPGTGERCALLERARAALFEQRWEPLCA